VFTEKSAIFAQKSYSLMTAKPADIQKEDFASIGTTTMLKGIAILIIIAHHVGVNGYFCSYFNPLGGIGVAMFLFLSGYGLSESYKINKLHHFWKKKFLRIIIPYLLWIPLYHIAMHYSILGSPQHLEIIPRFWFIEYLLIMYAAFYFLFPLKRGLAITSILLMSVALFFICNNLRAEQCFSFWAGVLFSLYKSYFEKNRNKLPIYAISLFLIGFIALVLKQQVEYLGFDHESIVMKSINLLVKFPIGASLIFFFLNINANHVKWLIVIGGLSYELYLSHIPFFMLIGKRVEYLILFIIQSAVLAYILGAASKSVNKAISKYV